MRRRRAFGDALAGRVKTLPRGVEKRFQVPDVAADTRLLSLPSKLSLDAAWSTRIGSAAQAGRSQISSAIACWAPSA